MLTAYDSQKEESARTFIMAINSYGNPYSNYQGDSQNGYVPGFLPGDEDTLVQLPAPTPSAAPNSVPAPAPAPSYAPPPPPSGYGEAGLELSSSMYASGSMYETVVFNDGFYNTTAQANEALDALEQAVTSVWSGAGSIDNLPPQPYPIDDPLEPFPLSDPPYKAPLPVSTNPVDPMDPIDFYPPQLPWDPN